MVFTVSLTMMTSTSEEAGEERVPQCVHFYFWALVLLRH